MDIKHTIDVLEFLNLVFPVAVLVVGAFEDKLWLEEGICFSQQLEEGVKLTSSSLKVTSPCLPGYLKGFLATLSHTVTSSHKNINKAKQLVVMPQKGLPTRQH